jgi:hypothetical protein
MFAAIAPVSIRPGNWSKGPGQKRKIKAIAKVKAIRSYKPIEGQGSLFEILANA